MSLATVNFAPINDYVLSGILFPTEIHLDFTALDDQDVLESFDFDSFLSDDDDIYDFSVPV